MNYVGRRSWGQVCFREIDVLHHRTNERNLQSLDTIKHRPQSVRSAHPAPSAISQKLYVFSSCLGPDSSWITAIGWIRRDDSCKCEDPAVWIENLRHGRGLGQRPAISISQLNTAAQYQSISVRELRKYQRNIFCRSTCKFAADHRFEIHRRHLAVSWIFWRPHPFITWTPTCVESNGISGASTHHPAACGSSKYIGKTSLVPFTRRVSHKHKKSKQEWVRERDQHENRWSEQVSPWLTEIWQQVGIEGRMEMKIEGKLHAHESYCTEMIEARMEPGHCMVLNNL
jgi:hypothetical protein